MNLNYEIVRFAVEHFAPGAIIHGTNLLRWYTDWDHFHSKRILFPVAPAEYMMDIGEDGATVTKDCAFIRMTPVGVTFTGVTNGLIDDLLTRVRLDYFLGEALPRIVQYSLLKAPPFRLNRTVYTWLSLYRLDPSKEQGEYLGEVTLDHFSALKTS